jgi:hypothetical protein
VTPSQNVNLSTESLPIANFTDFTEDPLSTDFAVVRDCAMSLDLVALRPSDRFPSVINLPFSFYNF